jgi:hypothetical protein
VLCLPYPRLGVVDYVRPQSIEPLASPLRHDLLNHPVDLHEVAEA